MYFSFYIFPLACFPLAPSPVTRDCTFGLHCALVHCLGEFLKEVTTTSEGGGGVLRLGGGGLLCVGGEEEG